MNATRQHKPDWDRLRRFIENDVTLSERMSIEERLSSDQDFRDDYERVDAYVQSLRSLPKFDAPGHIWSKIAERIPKERQYVNWRHVGREFLTLRKLVWSGTLALLIAVTVFVQMPQYPDYEVVNVQDVNGFGMEAEAYIANHDNLLEKPITQDALLAFFPISNQGMDEFDD